MQAWWRRNNVMVFICLGIYFLAFTACAWYSTGTYGGGDSWMHYLYSRYAFQHPHNFLDQWGKPLFTILASPWAQFGFEGVKLFNIFCAMATGYVSYLIARQHYPNYAWLSIIFVLSVPIYFVCVYSGLTEILFGLVLVCGIYLYQNFHERWGCLVISFLPFVRSEGYLIIPVFLVITLFYRQYISALLLAAGTVMFSIIGFVVYHNWLWVFSTNPYLRALNIYGKGPLLEFVNARYFIAGKPQVVLIVSAILIFAFTYFKQIKSKTFGTDRMLNIRFVLIFGAFVSYAIAHSIFWKFGIFGSLGLIRVMAGIGPCIGLTSFFALQYLINTERVAAQWKWIGYVVVLFMVIVALMPLKVYRYDIPNRLNDLEKIQSASCNWIKQNNLQDKYFYFFDPFVANLLNIDPFDPGRSYPIHYENNSAQFRQNSIIIWDSHFCPVDGHFQKRWLDENPNFRFLHEERNDNNMDRSGDTLRIRIYETLNNVVLKDMK